MATPPHITYCKIGRLTYSDSVELKSKMYSEIRTMEDFQRAKIEDRRRLLRMKPEDAQRLASSIPMNAVLRLVGRDCPSDLLEELSNGRRL